MKSFALLRGSPVGMIGTAIIVLWIAIALLAPLIAPFPPNAQILPFARPLAAAPDGGTFWLGTDNLGRDILSRIIWGAQTVLTYAPAATLSAYIVGVAMGLAAGYLRGWIDEVLSRLSDVILSFPILVLYIIIIATVGASALNIILAVTFASAPGIMRIVRGLVLDLRNRNYVAAAETRGESTWHIMLVEILPNARGPLIVDGCLRLGYVTITIGVLGFLGLGLPPPDPDWGTMVNQGRPMAMVFPHMVLYPCAAITSLVLGFNLLADGLREISLKD
jgi:peptide/nickel transport system permease protein